MTAISLDDRDRISRLEARYDSLATKADLAELKAEFKGDLHALETRLTKWIDWSDAGIGDVRRWRLPWRWIASRARPQLGD